MLLGLEDGGKSIPSFLKPQIKAIRACRKCTCSVALCKQQTSESMLMLNSAKTHASTWTEVGEREMARGTLFCLL